MFQYFIIILLIFALEISACTLGLICKQMVIFLLSIAYANTLLSVGELFFILYVWTLTSLHAIYLTKIGPIYPQISIMSLL